MIDRIVTDRARNTPHRVAIDYHDRHVTYLPDVCFAWHSDILRIQSTAVYGSTERCDQARRSDFLKTL